MKLFIFKPRKYMGDCAGVIVKTEERARELLNEIEKLDGKEAELKGVFDLAENYKDETFFFFTEE